MVSEFTKTIACELGECILVFLIENNYSHYSWIVIKFVCA